jgi:anaerobic ribonucleoside-triphosphate reductase
MAGPNKIQEAEDRLLSIKQSPDESLAAYIAKFERVLYEVNTGITLGGELRKNHSLNLASEIEVDVVELSYRTLRRVYDNPNKIQEAEDRLLSIKQSPDESLAAYICLIERRRSSAS